MDLNARTLRLVGRLRGMLGERRVVEHACDGGGRWFDFGIEARGGLLAGLELARACLADLAEVSIVPGEVAGLPCPAIQVTTDHPVEACLGSQYAGWAVAEGKFFAMGSGPMRAAHAHEPLFEELGLAERARRGGRRPGGAEAPDGRGRRQGRRGLPGPDVRRHAPRRPDGQPRRGRAGGRPFGRDGPAQAPRAEIRPPTGRLRARLGAPLPPVAKDDLAAIGRTNDAILYGARVVLCVTGDDASLEAVGPQVPSGASRDHGEPFAAASSPGTTTTSTPSTPTCSAPPWSLSRTSTPGELHASARSPTTSLARSFFGSPRAGSPKHRAFALVSGLGWHVQDFGPGFALACTGCGSTRSAFPKVCVGRVEGRGRDGRGGRIRPGDSRRRARPDDAAGEPRAGRLPDGRPPSTRGEGGARAQSAPGRRGGGRQIPGHGDARRCRAADPRDLGRRVGRRGPGRLPPTRRRCGRQAPLRVRRARARPGLRFGTGPEGLPHARASGLRAVRPAVRR